MILQLNPTIDVKTPLGDCEAMFIIDYGINYNTVWCCRMPGGEVKHFYSDDIRIYDNPMNGKGWDVVTAVNKIPSDAKRDMSFLKDKPNVSDNKCNDPMCPDNEGGLNSNQEDPLKCDSGTPKATAKEFFNSLADIGIRGFDNIRNTLYDREYFKFSLKVPEGCKVEIVDDVINFELPIK